MSTLHSRRSALRVGGAGLIGGLTYPQFLHATAAARPKARCKSIIFLHQWGGPGQHETFDPKPDAPDNVRGWYTKPIPTKSCPALFINENGCRTIAAKSPIKLTVVRCMAARRAK